MRIASAFINHESANAWYRMIAPLQQLQRRGHTVLWPGQHAPDASDYDLLYLQQFFTEADRARVGRLRERGVAVVWETDDDISAIPKSSPAYAKHGGRKGFRGRRGLDDSFAKGVEIARTATLMTTTSAHLAQLYADRGVEHVKVIGNRLPAGSLIRRRPRGRAGVTIGCTLAAEHLPDLERLRISEALSALLASQPGVRVVAIGLDLGLRDPRYTNRPLVPFRDLLRAESEFDVGIAPLADSPFSRARSDVKLREYAAAGAMWLASPVGPYRELGEQQGGLLVADDGWRDALERVVAQPQLRADLAERARAWVARDTLERSAALWESAFRDAVVRARRATRATGR
ncbi:glycosyltransferase [Conexibacter stalactiti]|uniref:Glycosyltransferase n=1 Tax=Conexibacter stalactiti TaxID=1940611 RepID=A0ABU4HQW0_9ACTN|nr:glycosyltransferase [Conexibacter stalactiti]MDW5594454.1 glycosyltransferase [Conexibacter stalactiti]MEC5035096.1 glycosyltransferase [Conexibacter stalactiti]